MRGFLDWLSGRPKPLSYLDELLEAWYIDYVDKKPDYRTQLEDMYETGRGFTFVSYLERYAERSVTCTEKQFTAFMRAKGHRIYSVNGVAFINGCHHITQGNVRSGHYTI